MKNTLTILIKFIFYYLAFTIFLSTKWIMANFGPPTAEQLIFQFVQAIKNIYSIPTSLFNSYKELIYKSLNYTIITIVIEVFFIAKTSKYLPHKLSEFITRIEHLIGKILKLFYLIIKSKLHVCLFIAAIGYYSYRFPPIPYFQNKTNLNKLWKEYTDPKKVNIQANNPKNLVLIYLESVENTYKNEKLFGRNLLSDLDKLGVVSFQNYKQVLGTWTMSATFGTQCGVPMKISYLDYDNICLSDILSKYGYNNVYMQGNSLSFTSTKEFFFKA